MAYGDRREWGGGVMMCPRGKLRLSFRIGVRKASGAWTVRVCERCEEPRRMPESEIVCRRCEPNGSPKSWRLVGLREARLKAGMPCEELARRAGIKPVTLEKAEKLAGRTHMATAAAIAEVLGAKVTELAKDSPTRAHAPVTKGAA